MRLSHRDFDALQSAILELHEYRDLATFRTAVPDIFLKIIAAEYFALNDLKVDLAARRIMLMDYWESRSRLNPDSIARMERFGLDHPFTKYSLTTGDPTALKFSDFFSQRQFRESELYVEFYQHFGVDRLLGIASFSGPGMATLNLTRRWSDKDFTERDRLILNLLRPHFDLARRNAELATAKRAAKTPPLAACGLTPREGEVAHWLANGKTNREVAVILKMQVRTVEKHVERILTKLGVENRTAAAVILGSAEKMENGAVRNPMAGGPTPLRDSTSRDLERGLK